jgi:ABC-type Fe3+ transport system substrate-binding protein
MFQRSRFLILFAIVLATPFVVRRAIGMRTTSTKTSNDLHLVIITAHAEQIRREFADAFSDWHRQRFGQGVQIDYLAFGGNDITRYFQASRDTLYAKLNTYNIDLAWGGGDFLFDNDLKKLGVLEPLTLDPAILGAAYRQPDLAGLPLLDRANPPMWFGTALSSFGIIYNRQALFQLGLPEPRTWSDLTDPRYRNWLILADPNKSSSARATFMVIVERTMADSAKRRESEDIGWARGLGLITLISSNARLFSDSSQAIPGAVSTGDAAAGMTIDFNARAQVDAVGEDRLGYVEPADATALNPDPVALIRGAPHRQLAIRFIEFCLSEPGQRLWITRAGAPGGPKQTSLRRLPIMASVYDSPRDFTDNVNPYKTAAGFNTSPARRKTFGILGDLIQASCIDVLDDLRDTRRLILESEQRKLLEAQLATFPLDQKQALALADRRKQMTPLQRIGDQRHLTDQFRSEYHRLRMDARQ